MNKLESIATIRHKLSAGNVSVGSWIQLPHASVAEILSHAGYDWIAVDLEHGSISTHQLPDLFRALELGCTLPLARIAEPTANAAKAALDAGAAGLIIPNITSRDQLQTVVDFSTWPPHGKRGVGFSRANLFGEHFSDYQLEATSPLLIPMIESLEALTDLEGILTVKGIDAVMVGPYDLSASLGITGQFDSPIFEQALSKLREACGVSNVPIGIHVVEPDPLLLSEHVNNGYTFIAYSIDSVFLAKHCRLPGYHKE